ncbi:hypothetical protein PW5551_06845 [Petrotoga sp. 9PW.55.5.1]|uniref:hypothetical protein n=1 Tax=Petrotoga sp. 9PW.55.5.1 TaxID=1308979 RepID=UPI000DC35F34|nr:hypothetical protein [Petrotoga sp. 9PW.55.5.1]RAO98973.1 hypothetical protein PW5551_06845 [Petrotoga sp. 9PW.55.5.1]
MKLLVKVLIPITLIIILVGCESIFPLNQNKSNLGIELNNKVSGNYPLRLQTNFYTEFVEITTNDSYYDTFEITQDIYLEGLEEGEHKLTINFLDNRKRLITDYSTTIVYDNTPPSPSYFNYNLDKGTLIVEYFLEDNDFSVAKLFQNETLIATSSSNKETFFIDLEKNKGIETFKIIFKDDVNNFFTNVFEIDTNVDKPPIINSDTLKVNVFSESYLDIIDDWDDTFLIFIDDGNQVEYISESLLYHSKEATVMVFDSKKNMAQKFMKVEVDQSIPRYPKVATTLISNEVDYISWKYDQDFQKYSIENYEKIFGWKEVYNIQNNFLKNPHENILFIRGVTSNNTHGFPSEPIISVADNFRLYTSETIRRVDENIFLSHMNSPYVVASNILLSENRKMIIESGSSIRFYNGSVILVEGTLYVMPGAEKTNIFGDGEIRLNGGTVIFYDTDLEGIKITGNGSLLFLKNVSIDDYGFIEIENTERVCIYDGKSSNYIQVINSSGVYILDSSLKEISLENTKEAFIADSNIDLLTTSINTRTVLENTGIRLLNISSFSYLNSINSQIAQASIREFSVFVNNGKIPNIILQERGTVITNDDGR